MSFAFLFLFLSGNLLFRGSIRTAAAAAYVLLTGLCVHLGLDLASLTGLLELPLLLSRRHGCAGLKRFRLA